MTTNNPNGRPAGKPNKTTKEVKEILKDFVNYAIDDMKTLYDDLGNRDKVTLLTRILPFVLPKVETADNDEDQLKDNRIDIFYHPSPQKAKQV